MDWLAMDWKDIRTFYLAWPWMLTLLLLIPAGWFLYLRNLREKWRKTALYFSHGAILERMDRQPKAWKRLLPPILFSMLAFFMIVGLSRPTISARVAVQSLDMMLVMDISLSMLAEDIRPDRISAAKEAATRFVERLPRNVRVGLEVFAGDRYVLSPPTRQHAEVVALLRALRREDLQPRTEIGSALHTALQVLERSDARQTNQSGLSPNGKPPNEAGNEKPDARSGGQPKSTPSPKAPERVIILLSDGDSHEGYPWERAAQEARRRNVAIHSVGIGSPEGSIIQYQGMTLPVNFDETTLRRIAEMAGGQYFRVFRESDFGRVYERIRDRSLHYEEREIDLTFITSGLALIILVAIFLMI